MMFATWIPCCKSVTNADKGEGVKNPTFGKRRFWMAPLLSFHLYTLVFRLSFHSTSWQFINYLEILGERSDRLDPLVGPATDLLLDQAELLLAQIRSVQEGISLNGHIGR